MADLNSEELQQTIRDLADSLNGLGRSAASGESALEKELKVRGLSTEAARQAGNTLDALGRTAVKLTGQIYKGQQGVGVFAEAVDDAATAIGALTFILGGPIVKVVTALTLGFFKLGRMSAEMSDALFKSYQNISRSGAAAADGLQGVFGLMQDLRLSTDELDQLNSVISENAQAFALFQGTVYDGARSFGALRKSITNSRLEREFMGLGMNTQEINESMAGFVSVQSRLGIQQIKDSNAVTKSLNAYIQEQDAITKITGATRRQQEEAANKALAIEQFRAKVNELVAKGDEDSIKEANRLMSIFKGLDAVSSDLSGAFASAVTGFVTEGAGVTGQLVAQGKLMEIANNRSIGLADAMQITAQGVEGFMKGVGNAQASVGKFNEAFGANYAQLSDFIKIYKDAGHTFKTVEDVQNAMRAASEAGVGAQIDARVSQMNSMQAMQAFVNIGVNPATAALATLAGVVEGLTSMLPGKRGAATAAGAATGAATGAAIGSVVPGIGTAIGAGVGAIVGGIGGFMAGGGGEKIATSQGMINPDDVLKFTSGTGSRDHFDKLEPAVKQAFLNMARDYNNLTGQKLQVNSAFRSLGEQAAVNPGANPKAAPGMSLHNQGRALDIQTEQADYLIASGLLGKHGFKSGRAFNDPPHIFMRDGGIVAGPKSGYAATLHGTEAVVPLPDGKTIPVQMPEFTTSMGEQLGVMGAQLAALESIVAAMRDQNSISNKILQATNN